MKRINNKHIDSPPPVIEPGENPQMTHSYTMRTYILLQKG